MNQEELTKFMPLEKSWIIRMGILDLLHGKSQAIKFLNLQKNLPDDLLALRLALESWPKQEPIYTGESGTLLRFLRFASWQLNIPKEFILSGTLKTRVVTNNPDVIKLSQAELLRLDGETSQWASAKALLGDPERLNNPPYSLKLTYEAISHWTNRARLSRSWEPKLDRTIQRQVEAFISLMKEDKLKFKPIQAEDYCFARAFDLITKEDGEKLWPQLKNHESNRLKEMELELKNFKNSKEIRSKDHRVVQAIAMLAKHKNKEAKFKCPQSVNKTWPLFWQFLKSI
jgi:hypothetical protein